MKISEGIKLKGEFVEIPDCSRDDLPNFFKEMKYKVGAEIGVYKGEFTKKLCKTGMKIYGIDPWIVYKNYRKHPKELPYDELYNNTKKLLEPYNCIIIKKTSIDALEDFEDESLDFVYIDGNHSLPYITQDIYEWYRKVKKGGIVSGHDYCLTGKNPYGLRVCHVKTAVDICAKIFSVKTLYVLGEKRQKEGEKRDKWRSWFFIKE